MNLVSVDAKERSIVMKISPNLSGRINGSKLWFFSLVFSKFLAMRNITLYSVIDKFYMSMLVTVAHCLIFRYSEKAKQSWPIFHTFFVHYLVASSNIIRTRRAKFLWPSQNIWTLINAPTEKNCPNCTRREIQESNDTYSPLFAVFLYIFQVTPRF